MPQKGVSKTSLNQNTIKKVYEQTKEEIQKGLKNPYASTGTPIDKLNGAAKFMAQLSNIGGGSVKTGGGGIKKGFNTVANNVKAETTLKIAQSSQKAIGKNKK